MMDDASSGEPDRLELWDELRKNSETLAGRIVLDPNQLLHRFPHLSLPLGVVLEKLNVFFPSELVEPRLSTTMR